MQTPRTFKQYLAALLQRNTKLAKDARHGKRFLPTSSRAPDPFQLSTLSYSITEQKTHLPFRNLYRKRISIERHGQFQIFARLNRLIETKLSRKDIEKRLTKKLKWLTRRPPRAVTQIKKA